MAHDVKFSIPNRPLGRADVVFDISRDGSKIGTLAISKGSAVWWPRDTTYGLRIGWKKFSEFFEANGNRVERRKA